MTLSLSKYVNRAAMEFDAEERAEGGTYIHYIAMSMSNSVNRAAMEFGGGERPDRRTYTTCHCPCQFVNWAAIMRDMGGFLTLICTCYFAILDCTWGGGCPSSSFNL